ISIANQVLGVAYDLTGLLGVGAVILVARALGQHKEDEAKKIATIAILGNAALSLLIAIVVVIVGPTVVDLINTPPEIVNDAVLYIYVIAVAMLFNGFLMAAVGVLRAFAHVKTILVLGVFANVLYLSLEFLLIYGYGPIPEFGVFGSALSTLIVRVTGVLLLIWVLLTRLQLAWRIQKTIIETKALLSRLLKLSYPSVLDNVAYGFYQLTLVSFIAGLGVTSVLGRSYTLALTAFLTLIVMTISQGTEVLVGYRYGEGNHKAAKTRGMRSMLIAAAMATALATIIYFLSATLAGLFTQDQAIISLVQELLFLSIFLQPVTAMNTILFHSLKVVGDVNVPVIFSQVIMWGMSLPLAYFFCISLEIGVIGLWYVFILEEAIKGIFMLYRWHRRNWPEETEKLEIAADSTAITR
ncbi:MAG: MATE family efflux transporter, partial [Pseudomonadales bacterium]|nr:MATE family efflux transporter [Pseudomonadales bacterium]